MANIRGKEPLTHGTGIAGPLENPFLHSCSPTHARSVQRKSHEYIKADETHVEEEEEFSLQMLLCLMHEREKVQKKKRLFLRKYAVRRIQGVGNPK